MLPVLIATARATEKLEENLIRTDGIKRCYSIVKKKNDLRSLFLQKSMNEIQTVRSQIDRCPLPLLNEIRLGKKARDRIDPLVILTDRTSDNISIDLFMGIAKLRGHMVELNKEKLIFCRCFFAHLIPKSCYAE